MKKIIFLSLLVIACILFFSQIKRGFFASLLLVDSIRPPETSIMKKFLSAVTVKPVTIKSKEKTISADLYIPQNRGKHFPILLVHDAVSAGKADKRIVLLAEDLSRTGFLVLVPDLRNLASFHLRASDAEEVSRCFEFLTNHVNAEKGGGGMIGLGFGSGPALLASADPRIRDKVKVVATFGGYYDLRNVMLFGMTGAYEYSNHRGLVRPDSSIRWMVAYKNLDLLHAQAERTGLKKILEMRNTYEPAAAEAQAQSLRSDGKAVYAFLLNNNPDQFVPLYETLPHAVRETAYQLSPARAMKYINAHLIAVHAMDDFAVPYTESMRLTDAAINPARARLALLPEFLHSMPGEISFENGSKRYIIGGWRYFNAICDFLEKTGLE